MSEAYTMRDRYSDDEIMEEKRRYAKEYYSPRVTPPVVRHLEENEIFVFGSNANGYHGGGAAAVAMHNFCTSLVQYGDKVKDFRERAMPYRPWRDSKN